MEYAIERSTLYRIVPVGNGTITWWRIGALEPAEPNAQDSAIVRWSQRHPKLNPDGSPYRGILRTSARHFAHITADGATFWRLA